MLLFADVVEVSERVSATAARNEKTALLAGLLAAMDPEEVPVATAYLMGQLPQGRVGLGYAALRDVDPPPADTPALTVADVNAVLTEIADAEGPGSRTARHKALEGLLAQATGPEQEFLRGLLGGGLRQGALAGVMTAAVAKAAKVPVGEVRRAAMFTGDLPAVASQALSEGREALARIGLRLFRPVQPMLAQTADDPAAALVRLGTAICEWKVDGARIQVHRGDDDIHIYTRNMKEVTDRLPEVVEVVADYPGGDVVLDGEVIALDDLGRPHPFQVTMSRFGTRGAAGGDLPLTPFFFDILLYGTETVVDLPATERLVRLDAVVPDGNRVPRLVTSDAIEAASFLAAALDAGHEGIMMKGPDAPYEAGRRGASWLKIKPAHTLDLVVLAVEWGSGRRRGWLSNIHLGARDPAGGGFVMLGKTFKGMTDDMLAWQTERFLELETDRRGRVVHVRPEQVVEVAFDGVQASSRYPGGMALRFARIKGYRHDKGPDDADTIDTVRVIFEGRFS